MSEAKLRCHALKKDGDRCSKNAREGCLSCGTHKEQEEALRQANVDTATATDGWTEPLLPAFDATSTAASIEGDEAPKSLATRRATCKAKPAPFAIDMTAKTESTETSAETTDDNVLQKLRGDFFRKVWEKYDGADFKALERGLKMITSLQDTPKTAFVMKDDFKGFGWKKREQWLDTHIVPALYPEA